MVSLESKINSCGSWPVRSFQNRDEAQDLVVLLLLAHLGIGVAEDVGVGVLGQKGQHPLLAAAALGDIVLLQQRVLAVEGDGVEIQVEGLAPGQAQLPGRRRTSAASALG